jgi:hypothetical protein
MLTDTQFAALVKSTVGHTPMTNDDVRQLAKANGVSDFAMDDVLTQFPNDGKISFSEWYGSVKAKKPHWLEAKMPFAGAEVFDIKAQTAYVRRRQCDLHERRGRH